MSCDVLTLTRYVPTVGGFAMPAPDWMTTRTLPPPLMSLGTVIAALPVEIHPTADACVPLTQRRHIQRRRKRHLGRELQIDAADVCFQSSGERDDERDVHLGLHALLGRVDGHRDRREDRADAPGMRWTSPRSPCL